MLSSLIVSVTSRLFFSSQSTDTRLNTALFSNRWHKLLRIISSLLLIAAFTACSSQPDIVYKGQDLDSLEQAANFITSKNTAKKLAQNKILLDDKAFALGAYDFRDDIDSRIPEDTYEDLLNQLKAKTPTLGDLIQSPNNAPKPTTQPSETSNLTEDTPNFPAGLSSPEKQFSYLTARGLAKVFSKQGIPVIPESMLSGVAEARSKSAPRLNEKEEKALLSAIKEKLSETNNDWAKNRFNYYQKEEKKFFALNITRPGVNLLESGVQYQFIQTGTGPKPSRKDDIKVSYRGTLLDGTEFDSSYARHKPEIFPLKAMISGFTQAMQNIPEGSKVIIYIPSQEAYKEKGAPGIPPGAAIIFEVELLKVNP